MVAYHKNKPQKQHKKPSIDPSTAEQIKPDKKIHTQYSNPTEYDSQRPVWSFKRMRRETKWLFPAEELICCDENSCLTSTCVLSKLADFESMTWREIKQQQRGGSGKSSNHFIDDNLDKLHTDARKRLRELQITENVFSLSIENKVRIYGILQSRVFEILWYDNEHEIYPVEK